MDEDMEMRELKRLAFSHEPGYSNPSSALGSLLAHRGPSHQLSKGEKSVADVQSKLKSILTSVTLLPAEVSFFFSFLLNACNFPQMFP